MRVLVLGAGGMLGHKLCQLYRTRFDTWTTVRSTNGAVRRYDLLAPDRILEGVDASRLPSIASAVDRVQPDAVINCIGIIKQLREAKNPLPSLTINALFPHQLAEICRASQARLIHISTDCVFSGRKGMYRESDVSDAEDLYGRSKFLGEIGGPGCLTLRTSIIGRELSTTSGLIEWFLSNRGGQVRRVSGRHLQRLHHESPGWHYRRHPGEPPRPRRALPGLLRSDQQVRSSQSGERDLPAWDRYYTRRRIGM